MSAAVPQMPGANVLQPANTPSKSKPPSSAAGANTPKEVCVNITHLQYTYSTNTPMKTATNSNSVQHMNDKEGKGSEITRDIYKCLWE